MCLRGGRRGRRKGEPLQKKFWAGGGRVYTVHAFPRLQVWVYGRYLALWLPALVLSPSWNLSGGLPCQAEKGQRGTLRAYRQGIASASRQLSRAYTAHGGRLSQASTRKSPSATIDSHRLYCAPSTRPEASAHPAWGHNHPHKGLWCLRGGPRWHGSGLRATLFLPACDCSPHTSAMHALQARN